MIQDGTCNIMLKEKHDTENHNWVEWQKPHELWCALHKRIKFNNLNRSYPSSQLQGYDHIKVLLKWLCEVRKEVGRRYNQHISKLVRHECQLLPFQSQDWHKSCWSVCGSERLVASQDNLCHKRASTDKCGLHVQSATKPFRSFKKLQKDEK